MIEQRTMFVVESSHNVNEILAMYDTEKKEVVCYYDDPEWFPRYDDERYFFTKQQADDYVANRQAQLRAKFPEVKAFIEEVQKTNKDIFCHDDEEYMGIYSPEERSRTTKWYKSYRRERQKAQIYLNIIKTGYLTINDTSFKMDDILRVKWYSDKVELVLKDDDTIVCINVETSEYDIIEELFGKD